jgi:shikimate kinase
LWASWARVAGDGIALLDTDRIVESREACTVREKFARDGEESFRRAEESALAECLAHNGEAVIAAAGGVVTREANREALNAARAGGRALVVWLRTDTDELARRVARGGHRPLLDNDPEGTLARLDAERSPLYASVSDVVVDTTGRTLDEVADLVSGEWKSSGRNADV